MTTILDSPFCLCDEMCVVKQNPCHAVTVALGEHEDRDCYTLEETQHFLNLLAKEPLLYQAFFTLAIYGGHLRGELCGLE
jgi:integrase